MNPYSFEGYPEDFFTPVNQPQPSNPDNPRFEGYDDDFFTIVPQEASNQEPQNDYDAYIDEILNDTPIESNDQQYPQGNSGMGSAPGIGELLSPAARFAEGALGSYADFGEAVLNYGVIPAANLATKGLDFALSKIPVVREYAAEAAERNAMAQQAWKGSKGVQLPFTSDYLRDTTKEMFSNFFETEDPSLKWWGDTMGIMGSLAGPVPNKSKILWAAGQGIGANTAKLLAEQIVPDKGLGEGAFLGFMLGSTLLKGWGAAKQLKQAERNSWETALGIGSQEIVNTREIEKDVQEAIKKLYGDKNFKPGNPLYDLVADAWKKLHARDINAGQFKQMIEPTAEQLFNFKMPANTTMAAFMEIEKLGNELGRAAATDKMLYQQTARFIDPFRKVGEAWSQADPIKAQPWQTAKQLTAGINSDTFVSRFLKGSARKLDDYMKELTGYSVGNKIAYGLISAAAPAIYSGSLAPIAGVAALGGLHRAEQIAKFMYKSPAALEAYKGMVQGLMYDNVREFHNSKKRLDHAFNKSVIKEHEIFEYYDQKDKELFNL